MCTYAASSQSSISLSSVSVEVVESNSFRQPGHLLQLLILIKRMPSLVVQADLLTNEHLLRKNIFYVRSFRHFLSSIFTFFPFNSSPEININVKF